MAKNPYGGSPGSGLAYPSYYKPTPLVKSQNNYFPRSEELGPDEMLISFVGSCPFPPRRKSGRGLRRSRRSKHGSISA